jgi:hypothetical protein
MAVGSTRDPAPCYPVLMADSKTDQAIEAGIKFVAGAIFLTLMALVSIAVVVWAFHTVF